MSTYIQDSDDDLYWGPITLKEKKRDVLRKVPVKYIKSRTSISVDPTFIEDKSLRLNALITCDLPPYHSHSTSEENEFDLMVTAHESSLTCDNAVKEEISTSYHSLSSTNSSFFQDVINISSEKESSIIKDDSNANLDNKHEDTCDIPKFTNVTINKDLINCFKNLDVTEEVKLTSLEEIKELMEESKAEISSSSDTSFKFNDTLEEMDRFMMYGQDYRMSYEIHDNNISACKTDCKEERNLEEQVEAPKTYFTKPTGIPILSRSATKTPINKKINQINLKKSAGKNRFKDIQSPVAMYIKHSGHTPLFKTLTPANIPNIPEPRLTSKVISNLDTFAFPAVCYKPAKTKKIIEEEFKLPNSISALIPLKAKVGVHQRRGRQLELIVDGDLTLADNTLNSTKDISVVEKKNVFM